MVFICCLVCSVFLSQNAGSSSVRVDLNPDDDRTDVLTRGTVGWRVQSGRKILLDHPGSQLILRATAETESLKWGWWKAGLDTGATLVSDGVTTQSGRGGLELVIHGLPDGEHSLATWHNAWEAGPPGAFRVLVNETEVLSGIVPSHRAVHDDDAVTLWIPFSVTDGQPVVVQFLPSEETGAVFLNALQLDGTNPALQARRPVPADQDEHVPESPELTWDSAPGTVSEQVWVTTDRQQLEVTEPQRVLTAGTRSGLRVPATDPFSQYYWRVDSVSCDAQGQLVRTSGPIWSFRVRRIAFPGAEGYGRYAAGGRGGRVLFVTSLEDSGPGSLRAAVDAEGPRTVIFRTGGTIRLRRPLIVRNPWLTVAGESAPGGGICVRGFTFGCMGTHDVILRHIRIRPGDESGDTMDGTGFASCDHCIMDHCSVSWSIDEAFSSRGARNITVQRCLIAEALNVADHRKYESGKGHGYAGSISGDVGSFHHNLLAHCAGRNWSLAGGLNRGGRFAGRLDIRNNVVYNWLDRTTDGGAKAVNFVSNLYLPGPATRKFHLLKPDPGSADDPQQYFVQGNRMAGHPMYESDDWHPDAVVVAPSLQQRIRLQQPFCEPFVTTHSVDELEDHVLSDVGANATGVDSQDLRILEEVRQRSFSRRGNRSGLPGLVDSQRDSGGWPELETGIAETDRDADGIPDEWEIREGMDPLQDADGQMVGAGGFTNLERWLHSRCGTADTSGDTSGHSSSE